MLSFLARTFLLLAAAFGLGAIGGRATRRQSPPKPADPRLTADRSERTVEAEPARSRNGDPDVLLAGAIAGETGSDVGGSNMLAESTGESLKPQPAESASPSVDQEPIGNDPSVAENAAATQDAATPAGDPADADEPRAAFASYGGSGISAGFERVGEALADEAGPGEAADGRPLRSHSRWSGESPAGGEASQKATSAVQGDAGQTGDVPHGLAASDIHGRTPPSETREGMPEDVLAAKHRSDSFDSDFRTVDYAKLGGDAPPPPASGIGAPDDGWTVPEDGGLAGQEVFEESHAAFRSGGGSAPIRGAPENDDPAAFGTGPDGTASELTESHDGEPARAAPEAFSSQSETPTTVAPVSNRLDVARDGVPDDLTRISGIGPSIERLLFANGIFHFDQIAAWTEADARWADALSGFRGRVMREKWIDQARAFAEAKN